MDAAKDLHEEEKVRLLNRLAEIMVEEQCVGNLPTHAAPLRVGDHQPFFGTAVGLRFALPGGEGSSRRVRRAGALSEL